MVTHFDISIILDEKMHTRLENKHHRSCTTSQISTKPLVPLGNENALVHMKRFPISRLHAALAGLLRHPSDCLYSQNLSKEEETTAMIN